jgi:HK97 family phage portal protein
MYQMQRAGVPVTVHTTLQIDSVYTACRVLTNAIIKMGNMRGYTKTLDKDNVPYRQWMETPPPLLENTWGGMFQFDGMTRTIMSMALFGEAFWYTLTRDRLMNPSALEVLHPAFMEVKKVKQDDGTSVINYIYGSGANKKTLDPGSVTHIPFMALPGATRALNTIQYGGVAFALALAALEYGQRWFAQGASPSFLLSTDQKLGKEEVERIADKFMIEHSGLQAAHIPLVVDSGMKVEKISSTPDEAQYLQTLQYARMVIAAWFGLPSHLVGGTADKGNVWGKSIQEQGIQLIDFTLSGYITRIEEAMSSLLPTKQYAAFNTASIQRASYTDLAAYLTAVRTTTLMTPNELRSSALEMGPSEDPVGDQLAAPLASNAPPGAPGAAGQAATQEDNSPSNDPSGE